MKAKLLGAVSAAALMGWVSVANAQGPMQLTEAQLDGVTSGNAGVSITVENAALTAVAITLFDQPGGNEVAVIAAGFKSLGTGAGSASESTGRPSRRRNS